MNNQDIEALLVDYFEVKQAILQMNFLLTQIQTEIVRLSAEEGNQEEIDELIQDLFVTKQLILQLTYILSLIQAEIVRQSTENAA